MDIFKSTYYIRCNRYLSFCGQWPYQNPKIKVLNLTLLILTTSTVFGPQFAKIIELRHSFHGIILGTPSILYYTQFLFKNVFAWLLRKEIKNVLEKIKDDFAKHKDENLKILHDYSEKAYKINTFYTVYMLSAVVAYSSLPFTLHTLDILFPINETRLAQKPRLIRYFVNKFDDSMYFIILHGCIVDAIAMVFIIGFDTLYFSFAHHVCALFVIVTNKVRDAVKTANQINSEGLNKNSDKCHDIIYREFAQAVIMHEYTLEFVYILESSFSTLNLFSIGGAMVPLTITGFEVLLNKGDFSEMVRYVFFALGELAHIFYYNWPGQKIRDHSLLVYESCYNCEWYEGNVPDKCKKLLNLMIVRSQRPCQLTAGKVYVLGLENFAAVIKLSMSYFTVLSSMM